MVRIGLDQKVKSLEAATMERSMVVGYLAIAKISFVSVWRSLFVRLWKDMLTIPISFYGMFGMNRGTNQSKSAFAMTAEEDMANSLMINTKPLKISISSMVRQRIVLNIYHYQAHLMVIGTSSNLKSLNQNKPFSTI